MTGHLFCFGLGYSAGVLAERLLAEGWKVSGTLRDPAQMAHWTARGVRTFLFDRERPLPDGALAGISHVLNSIPPDEMGDPVLDLAAGTLAKAGLAWFGYLSTTGVYGDHGGALIDETAPCRPTSRRAERRLAAEEGWRERQARGLPLHVFRLAGIYGPGRSVLDEIRAGRAKRIVKPGQVFSRIHVADIAGVLAASLAHPAPGARYNVCDDEPASSEAVLLHACALLGVAPPPPVRLEEAELSPMARSFWADSKRLDNGRMKALPGFSLLYPSFREGLRALL